MNVRLFVLVFMVANLIFSYIYNHQDVDGICDSIMYPIVAYVLSLLLDKVGRLDIALAVFTIIITVVVIIGINFSSPYVAEANYHTNIWGLVMVYVAILVVFHGILLMSKSMEMRPALKV